MKEPSLHGSIVLLVAASFCTEAASYSVLTPLLPHYAQELALSQASVGVLVAIYTVGQLPGAALSNRLTTGTAVRRAVVVALLAFGLASVGLGLSRWYWALLTARFVQGAFSGCLMASGIRWVRASSAERAIGHTLGIVWGAATLGCVIGPALAALALATAVQPVLLTLAVFPVGLALPVRRIRPPSVAPRPRQSLFRLLTAHHTRRAVWMVLAQSTAFGFVVAFAPWRLSHLGMTHETLALTIFAAFAVAAVASLVVGRFSDRHDRQRVIAAGLIGASVCLVGLSALSTALLATLATATYLGLLFPAGLVPALALLSDTALAANVPSAVPAAIIFITSLGESAGAAVGPTLAARTSSLLPGILLAAVFMASAALMLHRPPHGTT